MPGNRNVFGLFYFYPNKVKNFTLVKGNTGARIPLSANFLMPGNRNVFGLFYFYPNKVKNFTLVKGNTGVRIPLSASFLMPGNRNVFGLTRGSNPSLQEV
jgi:hypothetical protein